MLQKVMLCKRKLPTLGGSFETGVRTKSWTREGNEMRRESHCTHKNSENRHLRRMKIRNL